MGYLFVIPARDEPVAVILRRGPSPWYHVILWNTRRDTFKHGAWFKGRIYEDQCDLSPDGRLFVYFVHQASRGGTSLTHAWTAVSRPPWLHALVLWPQGTTYRGGVKFTAPRTLWGVSSEGTHPNFPLPAGRLKIADSPPELPQKCPVVPDVAGADWSGCDHQGNVIYSKGHILFRRKRREDVVVAAFTALKPDPKPAPDWATRPL
jgi:hypothetical protein